MSKNRMSCFLIRFGQFILDVQRVAKSEDWQLRLHRFAYIAVAAPKSRNRIHFMYYYYYFYEY